MKGAMNNRTVAITLFALFQGGSLLALDRLLGDGIEPFVRPYVFMPLYAVVIFVPLTGQLTAGYSRKRVLAGLLGVLTLVLASIAAHFGWSTGGVKANDFNVFHDIVVFSLVVTSGWFVFLAFAQTSLTQNRFCLSYPALFDAAWRNALLLFEAGVFVLLFWLLLALWAGLFNLIGIHFFSTLFSDDRFVYLVLAVVLGAAISLLQIHESLVLALRRQILQLFTWLLPLVSLIALLFVGTLPFSGIAPLFATGHTIILLSGLQIALVVFANAAYQDGTESPKLAGWLRTTARLALLTLPILGGIAMVALGKRVAQYGWSIDRVWAALLIAVLMGYAVGYAAAALRSRAQWLAGVDRTNITMALVLVLLTVAVNTPLLDPSRISTASQVNRLLSGRTASENFDFGYLRFELGRAGQQALAELGRKPGEGSASKVASLARAAADCKNRWECRPGMRQEDSAPTVKVFPRGKPIDPAFLAALGVLAKKDPERIGSRCLASSPCPVIAVDLNGDGSDEYVLFEGANAVFGRKDGQWRIVGRLNTVGWATTPEPLFDWLGKATIASAPHSWSDLVINDSRFVVQEDVKSVAARGR